MLVNQATNLTSQGCPSFTPSANTLTGSTYIAARVVWTATVGSQYVNLGHATFTFGP